MVDDRYSGITREALAALKARCADLLAHSQALHAMSADLEGRSLAARQRLALARRRQARIAPAAPGSEPADPAP
jgi:hypothetical protein